MPRELRSSINPKSSLYKYSITAGGVPSLSYIDGISKIDDKGKNGYIEISTAGKIDLSFFDVTSGAYIGYKESTKAPTVKNIEFSNFDSYTSYVAKLINSGEILPVTLDDDVASFTVTYGSNNSYLNVSNEINSLQVLINDRIINISLDYPDIDPPTFLSPVSGFQPGSVVLVTIAPMNYPYDDYNGHEATTWKIEKYIPTEASFVLIKQFDENSKNKLSCLFQELESNSRYRISARYVGSKTKPSEFASIEFVTLHESVTFTTEVEEKFISENKTSSVISADSNVIVTRCKTLLLSGDYEYYNEIFYRFGLTYGNKVKFIPDSVDGKYRWIFAGDGSFKRLAAGRLDVNGVADRVNVYAIFDNKWSEESEIVIPDINTAGTNNKDYIAEMKMNRTGTVLAVSVIRHHQTRSVRYGSVYIYVRNGFDWILADVLRVSENKDKVNDFGISLSMDASGRSLAIGENTHYSTNLIKTGAVRIYNCSTVLDSSAKWQNIATITSPSLVANNMFSKVSMTDAGDMIIVGAPGDEIIEGIKCGSIYIFKKMGAAWIMTYKSYATTDQEVEFGNDVSISGDGKKAIASCSKGPNAKSSNRHGYVASFVNIDDTWSGNTGMDNVYVYSPPDSEQILNCSLSKKGDVLLVDKIKTDGESLNISNNLISSISIIM